VSDADADAADGGIRRRDAEDAEARGARIALLKLEEVGGWRWSDKGRMEGWNLPVRLGELVRARRPLVPSAQHRP
jgi:hypothetical protein